MPGSAHARADGLHKLSTRLTSIFDTIVLEELNVSGMRRNRSLARHISDVGMGELRRQVDYKTTWYGRELVVPIGGTPPVRRVRPVVW